MSITHHARQELKKDLLLVIIGACIAFIATYLGLLDWIISIVGSGHVASFLVGIFFTSVFTVAPAAVALVHIANSDPILYVALWGAFGAMCGDLVLFFLIRDRFADDLMNSLKPSIAKHILSSFHLGFMKWLGPLFGALIIASPLPDEFAVTLMGISKTRVAVLMPVSFVMNLLAVYSLIWFAHTI